MQFCTNCGVKNEDGSVFCAECGHRIESMVENTDSEQAATRDRANTQIMPPIQPSESPLSYPLSGDNGGDAVEGAGYINSKASPARTKSRRNLLIVIAVAVAAAVLACGVVVVKYSAGRHAGYGTVQSSSSFGKTSASHKKKAKKAKESKNKRTDKTPKMATLDSKKLDGIVSQYGGNNAAVSVVPVESTDTYDSQQAKAKYVAAGLYLPVYLASHEIGNGDAESDADTAMRTMDNQAANDAIDAIGGLSSLNDWLSDSGYSATSFEREFGDVDSSNEGWENYTSASDAANMLASVAQQGDAGLLEYDLASEGVTAPGGTTINGHRGKGLKNSYNFFVIVKGAKGTAAVVVMTENLGQSGAVSLTNAVLNEVNADILQ